jgi:hypothetical protein
MSVSLHPWSVSGANTATRDLRRMRHQLIERRAYARWNAKGCPSGTAMQDWLEAEREVDTEFEWERWSYLISA